LIHIPVIQRNQTQPAEAPPQRTETVTEAPAPRVTLPPKIPLQIWRPVQSNIPALRVERDRLKEVAERIVKEDGIVPPLTMVDLRAYAVRVVAEAGVDAIFADFCAVLVNNATWHDRLAQVPYERRLLLLPKCLRPEDKCPAPFDQFGLLCKDCGLCSIQDLSGEAHRLGYAVLVAEGSALVRGMIETGKIDAIVGVSCLNVLEKCFPHMEAVAIPGMSIPLLQDDCVNTTVDMDQVWDIIHLTSDDKTYRLDLDALKSDVQGWFTGEPLDEIMGPVDGETDTIARDWMRRDGKRWRPYLTACVHMALACEDAVEKPELPSDLKKLAAAVECFHKASLVHDDIEDGDAERYGQAALHMEQGVPVALNVGDLLLGEGYRLIAELDIDGDKKAKMLAEAARGHVSLARGQGAELCWANAPRPLTSLEVLEIFRQKTAPAFEVALRLGGYYAGADDETHAILSKFSESLGIAYQIRDDLEDFTGESDSNDLADLRPSLILAIAHRLAREGTEQDLIESLWRRETRFEDVETEVRRILEERGVTKKASDLREAYEQQAINSLRTLTNPTLKGLLRRVIGKIFGDNLIEGYCSEFEARNAAGGAPGAQPAS
jgi:geranylgeranyl diphosphate synthase type II